MVTPSLSTSKPTLSAAASYRGVCFNSLRKFWTSRIKEFDHEGKDPLDAGNLYVHETAVPYVDFLIEYERFCKINHLTYVVSAPVFRQISKRGGGLEGICAVERVRGVAGHGLADSLDVSKGVEAVGRGVPVALGDVRQVGEDCEIRVRQRDANGEAGVAAALGDQSVQRREELVDHGAGGASPLAAKTPHPIVVRSCPQCHRQRPDPAKRVGSASAANV